MPTDQLVLDKESCWSLCAYYPDDRDCEDVKVTNSVAAGCTFAGFIAPGQDCD